jgi:hypothetical protein
MLLETLVVASQRDKKTFNFSMPKPIADAFDSIGPQPEPGKRRYDQRWVVGAAAVLRLLEMPEKDRNALMMKIAGAKFWKGGYQALVNEALRTSGESIGEPRPASGPAIDEDYADDRGSRKDNPMHGPQHKRGAPGSRGTKR